MKNLFLILAFAFSAALMAPSVGFSQAADDSKRTVNPGEDPNEARTGKPSEADVAAPGVCPECIARMKHTRLGDDTTYRPAGSSGSGSSEGAGSTKTGTR